MEKSNFFIYFLLIVFVFSCASSSLEKAETLGERNSSFAYIPLDPLPVSTVMGNSCKYPPFRKGDTIPYKILLNSFPDQTVRLSIAKIENDGSITYGGFASASGKNETYEVTLDYINVDVTQIPFFFKESIRNATGGGEGIKVKRYEVKPDIRFENRTKIAKDTASKNLKELRKSFDESLVDNSQDWKQKVIPVYIGVGLRIVARVTTLKADVNLSGLGVIASEAKTGRLKGSLTVQTLGITGKSVSSALPLPSEINETTIQNAILAIGTIKAQLYANDNNAGIVISPRVVGIYKPFKGGPEVINPIISELAREPVDWHRPCNKVPTYQTSNGSKKE